MKTDGNHPAFESAVYHMKYSDSADRFPGLTKREYFAAMAMQGYATRGGRAEWCATDAVTLADALIAALNEGQQ